MLDGELHPGFARVMGKHKNCYGGIVFLYDGKVSMKFDKDFVDYPMCKSREFDHLFENAGNNDKPMMIICDDYMDGCLDSFVGKDRTRCT